MKFKKLTSIVLSVLLVLSNIILPNVSFANDISSTKITNNEEYLATPTGLFSNQGTLSWHKVDNADGYIVYMSTEEDGKYEEVARVKDSNYNKDKCFILKDYYFKVRAYVTIEDRIVYSDYSRICKGKISFTSEMKLSVGGSFNSVFLRCSTPAWGSYEKYKIFKSTNKLGNYEAITEIKGEPYKALSGNNKITFTDTNIVSNQKYYYKVGGYSVENGEDILHDMSPTVEILTTLETPTITVTNSGNTNIIKWNKIPGATGYKIRCLYEEIDIKDGNTTSYTHKNLEYGKTYYYNVKAYNSDNNSVESNDIEITIKPKLTLATTKAKANPNTYNSNKITWNKVSKADGYEVLKATSKTGTYSKVKTTSSLSYINTSLTTGKTYYYKVRAYRVVNGKKIYSSYSNTVSAKPVLKTPNVTLKAGSKKITIKWIKISGAKGYKIYRSTSKNGKYSLIKTTTSSSYTNSKLKKGGRYYYKVRAYRIVNGKTIYGNYSPIKNTKAM